MNTEPRDLERAALTDALKAHWGITVARLDYMPVGFGSHHWDAVAADGSRWFVSADDLRGHRDPLTALDAALRTAAALRDGTGLEFVLAPEAASDGSVLAHLEPGYAVRVEPFVVGTAGADGEFDHTDDRRRVAGLVGRLHAASRSVPPGLPATETFALRGRDALERALEELDRPWSGGPYAEPARLLLQANAPAVRDRLRAHDDAATRLRDQAASWVVTHGEPHNANIVREASGAWWLVDWGTVLVAPRERDLWMVLDDEVAGWDEYRGAAGPVTLDAQALDLYRERWALAEICEYVALFGASHADTEDTRAAWGELGQYL